jgi:hypothetical protein
VVGKDDTRGGFNLSAMSTPHVRGRRFLKIVIIKSGTNHALDFSSDRPGSHGG